MTDYIVEVVNPKTLQIEEPKLTREEQEQWNAYVTRRKELRRAAKEWKISKEEWDIRYPNALIPNTYGYNRLEGMYRVDENGVKTIIASLSEIDDFWKRRGNE